MEVILKGFLPPTHAKYLLGQLDKHAELSRYDLYNEMTRWITHELKVSPQTEDYYHGIAQTFLEKNFPQLLVTARQRLDRAQQQAIARGG